MSATFSPSQVAEMTGVSLAAIRNYGERFAGHFSPGATPPKGQPREFTAEDIRLIGFIRTKTSDGLSLDQVAQAIEAGELEEFDHWQPAAGEVEGGTRPQPQPAGAALVPSAQVQALQALLEDYRRREEAIQNRADAAAGEARERERGLQDQIAQLQRELGKAEGELEALKSRRPWWRVWG